MFSSVTCDRGEMEKKRTELQSDSANDERSDELASIQDDCLEALGKVTVIDCEAAKISVSVCVHRLSSNR